MTNQIRHATLVPSALDRLRSGPAGGPLVTLPDRATTRPGLVETLLASRSEREIMHRRDAAAAAVEAAQIEAAVEVAVSNIEDIKKAALKARQVETARRHAEMEGLMMADNDGAKAAQNALVNRIARDTLRAEKQFLDEIGAMADSGQIDPDHVALAAEIARAGTQGRIRATLDLRDLIEDSQGEQLDRALSRKR